ncbi:helix-turn-helix domain-containing protein [Nostoc sp.]|uniref:helix-turn-helix domain-containing protein n=1 Tax=Nostoc sp. TaxID=1180 RepID=UPI002FFABD9F
MVKLNEYALKRGFLQVFGKPLFAYLHDYRLEQARQLLETGEMKVSEVAQKIGLPVKITLLLYLRKNLALTYISHKRCNAYGRLRLRYYPNLYLT